MVQVTHGVMLSWSMKGLTQLRTKQAQMKVEMLIRNI